MCKRQEVYVEKSGTYMVDISKLDPETRVEIYIRNVEQALEQIEHIYTISQEIREILDIVKAYIKDSKFYLKNGDVFTALATIAYAEGLLDALRLLGMVNFHWRMPSELARRAQTKVLTAGTFEILHPGHIYYLQEAWKLGRVVTIVARDTTVRKLKGRDVVINEQQRLKVVENLYYVHKARLGYEDDMLRVVEEERPNIILLGPDQPVDEDKLRRELERRGLSNIQIMRLPSRLNSELYSTSAIIKKIVEKFRNIQ